MYTRLPLKYTMIILKKKIIIKITAFTTIISSNERNLNFLLRRGRYNK